MSDGKGKENWAAAGVLWLGCVIFGAGIGLAYGRLVVGGAIGVGLGFLLMGLLVFLGGKGRQGKGDKDQV